MKKFIPFIILAVFMASCISYEAEEIQTPAPVKDGVFVHITSGPDDPHRVLMGLMMANKMSESQDVILYFDIKGIEVVLKDAPDITYAHFPSSFEQLKQLAEKGIIVMACPGCLKAAGKTPEDIMDGVIVADKDKFFSFTQGRILTLDY